MKQILLIILVCVCAVRAFADDERIMVDARLNGQPVRFAFDTGTGISVALFSTTAQKLGLAITPPPPGAQPPPGQIMTGSTGPCLLELARTTFTTSPAIVDTPAYLHWEIDGVLGWPALKNNIFFMDCLTGSMVFFTNLPGGLAEWSRFHIITNGNSDGLTLELSSTADTNEIIAIDSGSVRGAELSPSRWQAWRTKHLHQPYTLNGYYTPSIGVVVKEETWADSVAIGPLVLSAVPVTEADSSDVSLNSIAQTRYEATLGYPALKRLDIVIDGIHGDAYLRPKKTAPTPYEHNRFGAVFTPGSPQSDDLVAHVITGSPAFQAGIRDGDNLLKIGDLDCTKWRTDPKVLPLGRFWNGPAGTALTLTLSHGGKSFETTATLRNIIPPDKAPAPK